MNTNQSLAGKKIILFGGSSGLGFATARAAAAEGALVTIVSGNQSRIDQALTALPVGSRGFAVDLSDEQKIKTFWETADSLDHLVYTAGENLTLEKIGSTDIDTARSFFTLRYWGAFAAVKYGAPHINPGGSISLISGTASARPAAGWSIASSICGAIEGFVRAAAVELAPIRVNSVVPGVTKTNLWDSLPLADRNALYKNIGEKMLLQRVGEAEDIALAFLYLMKQSYGTGQNIVVDGGSLLV